MGSLSDFLTVKIFEVKLKGFRDVALMTSNILFKNISRNRGSEISLQTAIVS